MAAFSARPMSKYVSLQILIRNVRERCPGFSTFECVFHYLFSGVCLLLCSVTMIETPCDFSLLDAYSHVRSRVLPQAFKTLELSKRSSISCNLGNWCTVRPLDSPFGFKHQTNLVPCLTEYGKHFKQLRRPEYAPP